MAEIEMKNAPDLAGWTIAGAAGLVAFAGLVVIGGFDLFPAAFLGALVALLVGLILGMPWGAGPNAATAPEVAEGLHETTAVDDAPMAAAAPVAVPLKPDAPAATGEGPVRLTAPRGGVADDLKEIEGIGPAMEKLVNALGFYHYDQIANWTEADVAWVDANLKGFKGRVTRDRWVAQAKIIVGEGLEAFRIRARTNDY